MISRLILLANKYPNAVEPNVNVFTQQIAWSFADAGINVVVICPTALNYNKKCKLIKSHYFEETEKGNQVEIIRPHYFALGQDGNLFQKTRVSITTYAYTKAVEKVLRGMDLLDSALFAEFLCPCGVTASLLGRKYDIPSYMQCGEATYRGDVKYGNKKLREKLLRDITGVVALSGQNRDYLIDAGVVSRDKIIVLPSGYRKDRIFPRDKDYSREKFGLPKDKFIVGFCGSFDVRKGIKRLEKAIDNIQNENIVLAACGKGELQPESKKCVFCGPINHDELAFFYSAVDVFAFPTYHEGSCTAIVEAAACGCPIISSDRSFNYEICNNTNSILIDPDDINALSDSIIQLYNDESLRKSLSRGSLELSKELSLDDKVKKILDYIGKPKDEVWRKDT